VAVKIAQCSKGSYFWVSWIWGVSFKAVRLGGGRRMMRCPVHRRAELVRRIPNDEVTGAMRDEADANPRSTRVP
jgi:hypothetical protein